MILLFGEKAHRTAKNSNVKHPQIETSGVLSMNQGYNVFTHNSYDCYQFSVTPDIDYSMYSAEGFGEIAFMSNFSNAFSTLSEAGFTSFSADYGSCGSDSCGSFSSMC